MPGVLATDEHAPSRSVARRDFGRLHEVKSARFRVRATGVRLKPLMRERGR
jgi:hypothetical protein